MRTQFVLGFILVLSACRTDKSPFEEEEEEWELGVEDVDGDGFTSEEDCNDSDSVIHPGAEELCDGVDNDCDGEVDEGVSTTFYSDSDGDGFGDPDVMGEACQITDGWVTTGNDCDDSDASTYPSASERCDDIDNDCDGEIDEDVLGLWYADADADGFGDPDVSLEDCDPPSGYVTDSTDCDDSAPGAFPGSEEICDEIDNDCDGVVDEGVTTTWYADSDGDGWGASDTRTEACTQPSGYALVSGDCDDGEAAISPSATEVCNGIDDDCDGDTDIDVANPSIWYVDADGDGYGDADAAIESCDELSGHVLDSTDCDDSVSAVNPAAIESCNEVDDDCDGLVDDVDPDIADATTWYIDYDSDGAGSSAYTVEACDAPSGYVDVDDDCDDTDASAFPGGTEVCDEADNDCDGDVDEDDATDASTWYADADSDGYGDPDAADVECEAPTGTVVDDTDCDDTDATVYPGAPELYDSQDNDCDGDADEDLWMGTGADGSLSVTAETDLSTDASGSRSEPDAVVYGVSTISGGTLTLDDDADGIESGDEVMVINLQGSTSLYASVGTYEFASVASASADVLELEEALSETFGESDNTDLSDQVIIVQRVPNYTDVEVLSGATLTTSTWDGESGAVLAFRANGTVWVEDGGSIDVSALGYAAGDTGTCNNCDAFQGESIGGEGIGDVYGSDYNETIGGYLANLGGGGANITGGGGEYAGGATAGDSWYPGTYTAPEAGEEYGESELEQIFFGSGGGGVWNGGTDAVGEDPGPGGDGGGVLYIGASTVVLDGATALASEGGSTEHWAWGTWTYGAGGGSGGSVFIIADSIELASDSILAAGGLGQSSYTRDGGDGGDGRIRIDCSSCGGYAQGSTEAESALDAGCSPAPGHSESPE